jgi:serine/threonine-protein kinase
VTVAGENATLPGVPSHYEFLGEIAQDWSFAVYKVRHRLLNRVVVLKTVATEELPLPSALRCLRSEAQFLASLQHPNVVELYEVGEYQGRPFLVMEFVDGGCLCGSLWPIRQATLLAESVARTLHAVHQKGIIHRDIVPSYILLTKEGQPKITGFGSAARVGQKVNGGILGLPSYLPPEVALGNDEFSPATDVYTLGAILYELLTGRPPFREHSALKTVRSVVENEPEPPRRLRREVPHDLETICLKCLAKEPRRRYGTAEALADDLRRFLEGQSIAAGPEY